MLSSKSLVDKPIKVGKLKEFSRSQDKKIMENDNDLVSSHAVHIARIIPTIFGGHNKSFKKLSLKRL